MSEPAILKVHEEEHDEVPPSDALLHFTVSGSKLYTGSAALTQAAEVRKLAEQLEARGVSRNLIALEGVVLHTSKGLLMKSSSATYRVRVRVALEKLPDVLDAVPELKGCTMTQLAWRYDGAAKLKQKWLATCVTRAREKAAVIARAAGCELDGIESVREIAESAEPLRVPGAMLEIPAVRSRGSIAEELAGIELGPTRRMGVRVEVGFRLKETGSQG